MGTFIKKELNLKGKVKVVVAERLFVIRKGIELFLFMDLPKTKKPNLSKKELNLFKELSKILLNFSTKEVLIAINNGDIIEVKS